MPRAEPPARYDRAPHQYRLWRGVRLWRIHAQKHPASVFRRNPSDQIWNGGRFDATGADQYPCLYAGLSEDTALAEALLRDVAPDERGYRVVPYAAVEGKRIACLALLEQLTLVSLIDAADLGAVGQDSWLVDSPSADYPYTRAWAHWLRRQAPWAHGLIWDSKRDRGRRALVLFGDRLARDFGGEFERTLFQEVALPVGNLDDGTGAAWANQRLLRYGAVLSPAVRCLPGSQRG